MLALNADTSRYCFSNSDERHANSIRKKSKLLTFLYTEDINQNNHFHPGD